MAGACWPERTERIAHALDGDITNQTATTGTVDGFEVQHQLEVEVQDREVFQITGGFEIPLGQAFTLNASGNYTKALETFPLSKGRSYESFPSDTPPADYDFGRDYFPFYTFTDTDPARDLLNQQFWTLDRFKMEASDVEEETYSVRIGVQWDGEIAGHPGFLKT